MTTKTRLAATCALFTFLAGITTAALRAQQPEQVSPAEGAIDVPTAPVVIDGRALFSVRGYPGITAAERAEGIAERIVSVAEGDAPAASLTIVEAEHYTQIMAGTTRIMAVLDADALLEGLRRAVAAESYRDQIRKAVDRFRYERRREVIATAAGWSLAATLAFAVVLLATFWAYRRARVVVQRRFRARVRDLQIKSFQVLRAERIWLAVTSFLRLSWIALAIVATFVYLHFVLVQFPWTMGLGLGLASTVTMPLRVIVQGALSIVPNLVFLAILAIVTRYVLKILKLFFDAVAAGRVTLERFDPEWATPTYRLIRLLVIAFAIIMAYPYVPGSQTEAFKGVSLFLGVVFSLGSSSFIGNMIAGYSMTYRRAFHVGDRVKIANHVGDVEQVRLMVTHLRTLKNEELVVPNSTILGSEILNYSAMARTRGLILHTTVGIGYETPWRQVEAMLLEAAARTQGLLREPLPFVLQKELGDFAVTYELNAFCDDPSRMMPLYTDLHRNILDLFNEYGVQIMTPAYEGDPGQPKVVAKSDWYLSPAAPPAREPGS